MIRGILFDMDGVLLDTEKIYFQCWKQSAREFGFELDDETTLAVRSCCKTYAAPFFKRKMGDAFDYLTIRDRRRELVSAYMESNGITQKPGILPLLTYCHEKNILTAVATATAREDAQKRLKMAGLSDMFSNIVGGDQVQNGKPDPDIYRIAAEQVGLSPQECAAIEDSPNGIIAAFAAGCHVIMVPDLTPPVSAIEPLLSGIAANLEQVIPILETL